MAALLAAALLLPLAGCARGSGVNSFTWFVEEIPANLDPQVAAAPEDVLACKNLYGGLVRLDADGVPQPVPLDAEFFPAHDELPPF